MAATNRRDIIDLREPGIYHCWSRCVRRALLCGLDKYSKKDYNHRRDWIEGRVKELARWFGIAVAHFAIMGNHFHLVLKTLPHLVKKWSDKQVVKRSIKIFPCKFKEMGVKDGAATHQQVRQFVADRKLVKELRSRLADPSWFLRQLKQHVAARGNAEDDCTGHFWQGRFKCSVITDELGLFICGVYVDLNQIRAMEAASLEESNRTSAYRRLKGLLARRGKSPKAADWDAFLCPISTRGDGQGEGYPKAGTMNSLRVSDKGLFEMSLKDYLRILDWTGRQVRRDKRGKISDDSPPILERLGLSGQSLVAFMEGFETLFGSVIGTATGIRDVAKKLGRRWIQGAKKVAAIEAGK